MYFHSDPLMNLIYCHYGNSISWFLYPVMNLWNYLVAPLPSPLQHVVVECPWKLGILMLGSAKLRINYVLTPTAEWRWRWFQFTPSDTHSFVSLNVVYFSILSSLTFHSRYSAKSMYYSLRVRTAFPYIPTPVWNPLPNVSNQGRSFIHRDLVNDLFQLSNSLIALTCVAVN